MTTPNFPTLSSLLKEDIEDDIVAGVRKVIGDLSTGWSSPYAKVEKLHKTKTKKLSPAQKTSVRSTLDGAIEKRIIAPKSLLNVQAITNQVNTKEEAAVVLSALMAVALGIKQIDKSFIRNCADILTPAEVAEFNAHADDMRFTELPMGKPTLDFIADHKQRFLTLLDLNDDLVVDVPRASTALRSAIAQTPVDGNPSRKETALSVHYLLHHIASSAHTLYISLAQAFKRKDLSPDAQPASSVSQPPEAPTNK
jgi:hypothetical protein